MAVILTIVNEPATVIAAKIPTTTPIKVVLPSISLKGFVMKITPTIHQNMFKKSYLVIRSPIAKNANMEVNIGDVNVKVVAIDIGFNCKVRNANNADRAANTMRILTAFLCSGSMPITSTFTILHKIDVRIINQIFL